jgi:major type 1 subunit fimbrin (pilin)
MNKTLLSAALIAGFGIAALAPQAARATDGTITFAGKIVANTCTIASTSVGGSGTASFTVTLPTVAAGALGTTAGTVAGTTPFSINLSACTSTGTVKTYFEPGATIKANGHLTAGLANLDLQLLNAGQAPIDLSTQAGTTTATIATGAATLNYFAQYYNTGGTVATGNVASSVNYTVVYP